MLAKDIIKSARFKLSDMDGQRFSDARLLSLLTDALKDIALKTTLMRKTIFVGISDGVVDYDLSSFAFRIHRIEYLDVELKHASFQEMDTIKKDWQLDTGETPKRWVGNEQKQANFKLYPRVSNAENTHVVYTSFFGIVTYISYSDILPILAAGYGDMSSLGPAAYLKVYYTAKPDAVTDFNQVIDLDDMCLEPLAHYLTGYCFRDNADTQNRNIGNESLMLYMKLIDEHTPEKARSHNTAERKTYYNPMGQS